MHSRSVPSAAPSADRISDRLDDGSAETRRSARPCRRVSWRRADESTGWPDTSATTSSGWPESVGTSPATRPWRSTTMRSASRNICSTSWETIKIVVPCSRRLVISPSTWAVSVTPRDAVGSSRSSSCGLPAIARATASSWRCPPERVRTPREGSSSGIPRARSSRRRGRWPRVGEQEPAALAPEQHVRGDVQVVAERQILPDHRDPAPQHRRRVGGTACRRVVSPRRRAPCHRKCSAPAWSCPPRSRRPAPPARPAGGTGRRGPARAAARTGRRAPGRTAAARTPSAPAARHLRSWRHCGAFPGRPARGAGPARPAGGLAAIRRGGRLS